MPSLTEPVSKELWFGIQIFLDCKAKLLSPATLPFQRDAHVAKNAVGHLGRGPFYSHKMSSSQATTILTPWGSLGRHKGEGLFEDGILSVL